MRRTITVLIALVTAVVLLAVVPATTPATAAGTGTISGTVTFNRGPVPYDICVVDQACRRFTTPDYALTGLAAGTYQVELVPGSTYIYEYYGGGQDRDAATAVVVTDGSVTDVDWQTKAYPTISASVTGPGGQPVPDNLVNVRTSSPVYEGGRVPEVRDGAFTATVQPGLVRVYLQDKSSDSSAFGQDRTPYTLQYLDDSPSFYGARVFEVGLDDQVVLDDVQLARGGEISGRLTDPYGFGVPIGILDLERKTTGGWERYPVYTLTRGSGAYRSPGLPAGTYRYSVEALFTDTLEKRTLGPIVVPRAGAVTKLDIVLPFATTTPPQVKVDRRPRLVGTARAGRVLRVAGGAYRPRTAALRYRWYADGRRLRATGSRLRVTDRLRGTRVRVEVTASGEFLRARTITLRKRIAR